MDQDLPMDISSPPPAPLSPSPPPPPQFTGSRSTQSETIVCPLDTKMSILSLYDRWRKISSRQLYYHGYVSLCAIHCGLLQIRLAYSESTSIDPPLILTLLFLRRTFTKSEELTKSAQHLYNRHHRLIPFTETNLLNCLCTGKTLVPR